MVNWDVSGIPKSFWGQLFEVFASGICVSAVQNMVPELLRIGPILSVCLSVVCSTFFSVDFWTDSEQNSLVIS